MLRTTPFDKGLVMVVKEGKLRLVFIVPAVAVAYRSCSSAISLPLASALSPLVLHLLIFGQSGWVLSSSSLCARRGRILWAHIDNIELLTQSQIPLGTPTAPTPTGWGSVGPSSPTVPTGRRPGGIHIKVTRDFEENKCQRRTTVFSNDAVLIRCCTRLWMELMLQEEHTRQVSLRTVPPQLCQGGWKYTDTFWSTRDVQRLHHNKVENRTKPISPNLLVSAVDGAKTHIDVPQGPRTYISRSQETLRTKRVRYR